MRRRGAAEDAQERRRLPAGRNAATRARVPRSLQATAVAVALLASGGCSSDDPDVYVAGWESNGWVQVATLWKNGAPTALSDGLHGALATAVAISRGDVYVAGGVDVGPADAATYWKNGVPVQLTDGSVQAFAEAIAVSGSDVYVAGYEERTNGLAVAKVWKNGVATALTDGSGDANARAIAVSGSDVYAAGYEIEATQVSPTLIVVANVAKYWKNGAPVALTDGTNAALASAIAVSGSDVYVAGYEFGTNGNGVAKLWKNGVATDLTDGMYGALATSLVLDGEDVFVGGVEYDGNADVAKVWIDGSPIDLNPGGESSIVHALAVGGFHLYCAGRRGDLAVYWQRRTLVALTDGRFEADALSIAVVGR